MKNVRRDQYTIVLEDLRSQFKVFGEGLLGLNDKVDGLSHKIDGIERKVDSHTGMIGQLLTDVSEIKQELKFKIDRRELVK